MYGDKSDASPDVMTDRWRKPGCPFYVVSSAINGKGVFAGAVFGRGMPVIRCEGKVLRGGQVTDGMRSMQIGPDRYLATEAGSPTLDDFVNHSCDPNVGFVDGSLVLYALRDIHIDDEVVFDYSTCMNEHGWSFECRCGSALCRGRVTSFCDLSRQDRRRLLPIALAYLRTST